MDRMAVNARHAEVISAMKEGRRPNVTQAKRKPRACAEAPEQETTQPRPAWMSDPSLLPRCPPGREPDGGRRA